MLAPRIRAGRKQQGMGWQNLGEKPVVETPWFRLNLADGQGGPAARSSPMRSRGA